MNNSSLGMIRQFCNQNFDNRHHQIEPGYGYDTPNFLNISKAYNINCYRVERPSDIDNALNLMWKNPNESFILDVTIPIETYVAPKVPYGNALNNMIPANPGEYPVIKRKFIINK